MFRQILFIGIFLLVTFSAKSQIKLEGTINSSYQTFLLDDGELRYLRYNEKEKNLCLINLDGSLWKRIKLPLSTNEKLDEIKSVSNHIFNSDDNVEIIYSSVEYKPGNETIQNFGIGYSEVHYSIHIVTEKEISLLSVPESSEIKLIQSEKSNKLIVYKHLKGRYFTGEDQTLVYSF